MTGRITGCVPFLPFVEAEQAVVACKFMREIWHKVRKPINTGSGNLKRHAFLYFVDDGKIALYLARREYDIDLGARALDNAVKGHILLHFCKAFDQRDPEVADKMNLCPLENYEIRLLRWKVLLWSGWAFEPASIATGGIRLMTFGMHSNWSQW